MRFSYCWQKGGRLLSLVACNAGRQRGERNIISLQDIRTGDVEHGDTHLRTKQSIAKLMSEAEKQYVAEYVQKSPPGSASQHVTAVGVPAYLQDGIKVQQLNDGAAGNSVGNSTPSSLPFLSPK